MALTLNRKQLEAWLMPPALGLGISALMLAGCAQDYQGQPVTVGAYDAFVGQQQIAGETQYFALYTFSTPNAPPPSLRQATYIAAIEAVAGCKVKQDAIFWDNQIMRASVVC